MFQVSWLLHAERATVTQQMLTMFQVCPEAKWSCAQAFHTRTFLRSAYPSLDAVFVDDGFKATWSQSPISTVPRGDVLGYVSSPVKFFTNDFLVNSLSYFVTPPSPYVPRCPLGSRGLQLIHWEVVGNFCAKRTLLPVRGHGHRLGCIHRLDWSLLSRTLCSSLIERKRWYDILRARWTVRLLYWYCSFSTEHAHFGLGPGKAGVCFVQSSSSTGPGLEKFRANSRILRLEVEVLRPLFTVLCKKSVLLKKKVLNGVASIKMSLKVDFRDMLKALNPKISSIMCDTLSTWSSVVRTRPREGQARDRYRSRKPLSTYCRSQLVVVAVQGLPSSTRLMWRRSLEERTDKERR